MEFKFRFNDDLICCAECYSVIDKRNCGSQPEQDRDGHFFSDTELKELLTKHPYRIIHKYSDLEQEIDEYMKYCFVCKKVTRFKKVKFEED